MKEPTVDLHSVDFHSWAFEQAERMRCGDLGKLDWVNLIEEIESLGRSEQHELSNRLAQLLTHLLKWEFQGLQRSRSWKLTIKEQRRRVETLLRRMPSLRPKVAEVLEDAYSDARLMAERETGMMIATFPEECPYAVSQILDPEWLPVVEGLPPE